MANETPQNGVPRVIPSVNSSLPIAKSSLSNGSSVKSLQEMPLQKSVGQHSQARHALLSRTGVAKSESLLRTITDTPLSAPASPRLGP